MRACERVRACDGARPLAPCAEDKGLEGGARYGGAIEIKGEDAPEFTTEARYGGVITAGSTGLKRTRSAFSEDEDEE